MAMSGREKATIFLSILGADASSKILRHLPEEIADLIASGINQLPSPSPEALTTVLQEFRSYMTISPPEGRSQRGQLGQATYPGRRPPVPEPGGPLGIIRRTPPDVLAGLLSTERVETIGFVAAHLEPEGAELFLEKFGDRRAPIESVRNHLRSNKLTSQVEERVFSHLARRLAAS